MSDTTRARIVRGWLLCAATVVAWLAFPGWPWWAIIAPALPMFVSMCCCGGGCKITCPRCASSEGPCEFEVVIDGVANATCTDCANVNTTFLVTFLDVFGTSCRWRTPFTLCGTGANLEVIILFTSTSRIIRVQFPVVGEDVFVENFGAGTDGTDCLSIDADITTAFGFRCSLAAATCHVTAVQ
jgi:hypothetical protein